MATDFGLSQVSEIFRAAYDKPLDDGAQELWRTLFRPVGDSDLVKAAYQLVAVREKASRVSPAEIKNMLRSIGVSVEGQKSGSFYDDPAVKAINGHYRAMLNIPGITLTDWLKQEGLNTFREAMDKYGDRPTSAEVLLSLVETNEVSF